MQLFASIFQTEAVAKIRNHAQVLLLITHAKLGAGSMTRSQNRIYTGSEEEKGLLAGLLRSYFLSS